MVETIDSAKPTLSRGLALVYETVCLGKNIIMSEAERSFWARQRNGFGAKREVAAMAP